MCEDQEFSWDEFCSIHSAVKTCLRIHVLPELTLPFFFFFQPLGIVQAQTVQEILADAPEVAESREGSSRKMLAWDEASKEKTMQ